VFIVNDNYAENSKNDLFPLTVRNPGCQRATGNWKSYRNYSENYRNAIEKLSAVPVPVYSHDNNSNGNNTTPRMAYTMVRTRKKTTTSISAFFSDNSSHQIKQKHSSAKFCCARCARRSAQNVFLHHESLSRIKRK